MSTEALRENLTRLAENVGDECKAIRTLINGNEGDLLELATVNKANLVAAINELKAGITQGAGAIIDDTRTRTDYAWSSSKISALLTQKITTAQAQILGNAPSGLNSLEKLASAIGNRVDFIQFVTEGLSNRVRTDVSTQGLGSTERQNARLNIGAASQSDLGPDIDYASLFRTGLL